VRVDLQPAYVLHSRPYRDSSLLLEIFSLELGRLGLVVRGARRRRRGGSQAALLQPFAPLLLSWSGHSELKTLRQAEAAGPPLPIRGRVIYSALYVNELLMRLLHRNDAHPALFGSYAEVLDRLSQEPNVEPCLRTFELSLLNELGYGFSLEQDGLNGAPVQANEIYSYHAEYGLVPRGQVAAEGAGLAGAHLLALAAGDYEGEALATARRLLRQALAAHLGPQPLRSRELFSAALSPKTPGEPREKVTS
jgi:DNA repair protein RecO (recombination protein O)